ncbi:MAG: hypothetical protein ACI8X5_000258 [Planctomycetota bacterium]|jgi:hypothetical protein
MRNQIAWSGRVLIGSGILLSMTFLALPFRGGSASVRFSKSGETPAPQVQEAPMEPKVRESSWFGHQSGGGSVQFEGLGDRWILAGPAELSEYTDGSGRLTGTFVDARNDGTFLRFYFDLLGRVEDETGTGKPGVYASLEGNMLGFGDLEGGLVRVVSGEEQALGGFLHAGAPLSFQWEWISTPSSNEEAWSETPSLVSFGLDFESESRWGVQEFSFDLGSVPGNFIWVSGGQFVENTDGSASLNAVIAEETNRQRSFKIELNFTSNGDVKSISDRFTGSSFSRSYQQCGGRLVGMDEFDGSLITLQGVGGSFDVFPGEASDESTFRTSGEFTTRVEQQPKQSTVVFRDGAVPGSVGFALANQALRFAFASQPERESFDAGTYALQLGELGSDFVFESGGTFIEDNHGYAELSGLVSRKSSPGSAFHLNVQFSDRWEASESSSMPWYGMRASAYSQNGGPVSTESWHYYGSVTGNLTGLRDLDGLSLDVNSGKNPLQVGFGANGRSFSEGGHVSFRVAATGTTEDKSLSYRLPETGLFCFELTSFNEDSVEVVRAGEGFWIGGVGDDFDFVSGGRLRQAADGSARLTGVLERRQFPDDRFFLDAQLDGRRDTQSAAYPPLGSPVWRENETGANAELVASWTYYTDFDGKLFGLGAFDGSLIAISRRGPAVQMGLGASRDCSGLGASVQLNVEVLEQPTTLRRFHSSATEGGIVVELGHQRRSTAKEAYALSAVQVPAGHAFYLPGIAEDFTFPEAGSFQEFGDGRACLEGRIVSSSNPELSFDVRMDFEGRFESNRPGQATRQLPESVYADRGGPVDTQLWHYYRKSSGILVGVGELIGSVIQIAGELDALQVGLGANGRNLNFGASGDFELNLLCQPMKPSNYLPEYYCGGEIHINLPASSRE